jgi:hypothetical protein
MAAPVDVNAGNWTGGICMTGVCATGVCTAVTAGCCIVIAAPVGGDAGNCTGGIGMAGICVTGIGTVANCAGPGIEMVGSVGGTTPGGANSTGFPPWAIAEGAETIAATTAANGHTHW